MKAFTYNGEDYLRLIPSKRMFQSTMVHDVVNRGDIFAMRLKDQQFTVIPGNAEVKHWELKTTTPMQALAQELLAELKKGEKQNG